MRTSLVSVLLSSLFVVTVLAADEEVQTTTEPQWAPTGRLSQFRGFVTPRPQLLPENAQLMYASIWAAWSAWSFCSNGVQIRVRACNTVKGFSCLGANQETKPCENMITAPSDRNHHQPLSDYDVIDPWQADREEALKQLYPDEDEKKHEPENQSPVPGSFKTLSAGKTHQLEPPPYNRPSALGAITHELADSFRPSNDYDGAPGSTPERIFGAKQFAVKNNEHKERKHKGSGKLGSSEKSFEKEEQKINLLNLVSMDEKSAEVANTPVESKTNDEVHSTTAAETTTVVTTRSTVTTKPSTTTSTTLSTTRSTTTPVTTTTPHPTSQASIITTTTTHKTLNTPRVSKLTRTDLENQRKAIGDRISRIFSAFDDKKIEHVSGEALESLQDRPSKNDRIPLFEADLRNAAKVKAFRVDEEATDPTERVEPKRKGFGFTEVTTTESSSIVEVVPEDQISPDTLSALDWMLKNMTKAASDLPIVSESIQSPSVQLAATNGAFIADDGDVEPVAPVRETIVEVSAEAAHPKKHLPKRKIRKLKKSHKSVERDSVLHLGDYSPINPDPLKMFPKFKAKPVEQARARALGVRTFNSDKDSNVRDSEKFPSDKESEALMNEINQLQKLMKDMDQKIDDLNQQQESSMDIKEGDFGLPDVQGSEIFQAGTQAPIKFFDEGVSEGDNEGKWTDWSEWGMCFCGKQVRTRICSYTQASTGCKGSSHESRDCGGGFCPRAAKKPTLSAPLTETPSNPIVPSSQHSFKPIRLQQAAHLLP